MYFCRFARPISFISDDNVSNRVGTPTNPGWHFIRLGILILPIQWPSTSRMLRSLLLHGILSLRGFCRLQLHRSRGKPSRSPRRIFLAHVPSPSLQGVSGFRDSISAENLQLLHAGSLPCPSSPFSHLTSGPKRSSEDRSEDSIGDAACTNKDLGVPVPLAPFQVLA